MPGRLEDRSRDRDLAGIHRGDAEALGDLADGVHAFVDETPAAGPAIVDLAGRTAGALTGRLKEQSAQQLARDLWIAVAEQEMSERQIEAPRAKVQSLLASIGAAEEKPAGVADQVWEVWRLVANRPRRWHEVF